jgi:uncharacterized protein (TIRG00374 family)
VLLILANLLVLVTLSSRWWLFLYGQGFALPFWRLLGYRVAAFAVSYFTPGPHFGGEPLQVYLVSSRHGVPAAVAIAAVTLDKLLEMVINLLVLGFGLVLILQQQVLAEVLTQRALYLAIGLLLLPLPVLSALFYGRYSLADWLATWSQRGQAHPIPHPTAPTRLARWVQTIRQSEAQVVALWQSAPLTFLIAGLVSVLSWLTLIGEFWYMTHTLALGLSFAQAMTLLLAMRVAILLPMPAGLGALEASLALATSALGLHPAAGIGLSLMIRLRDVVLGIIGLWLGGFTLWRSARRGARPMSLAPDALAPQQGGILVESWPRKDTGS